MGLDISIRTDKNEEIFTVDYLSSNSDGYFTKHKLSRTFCNFMCRQNVVDDPELDQIGRLTGIDISPLYEMESFQEVYEGELNERLEMADDEEEREEILEEVENNKAAFEKLKNNLDKVAHTISGLIEKLSIFPNLQSQLNDSGNDTLNNQYYFSDFNQDKGNGYIGNNFGQDLRNFHRFLAYAKGKGATTVYFEYG